MQLQIVMSKRKEKSYPRRHISAITKHHFSQKASTCTQAEGTEYSCGRIMHFFIKHLEVTYQFFTNHTHHSTIEMLPYYLRKDVEVRVGKYSFTQTQTSNCLKTGLFNAAAQVEPTSCSLY